MTNLEQRVFRLEGDLRAAQQAIRDLQVLVGTLQQNQFAGLDGFSGGSGGGFPLFCVLSAGLAASGAIPSGSPTNLASQHVYSIQSGAFTSISTTASVWNGLDNAIASGSSCIVLLQADGSYAVIGVAC